VSTSICISTLPAVASWHRSSPRISSGTSACHA
ncbi:glutamate decarboxylase alpha (GAD-alpha), partial [Escherichia marmotae]